jgi:hypothetical protein
MRTWGELYLILTACLNRILVQSMSGTMEFQMLSKLYSASRDLCSGFSELKSVALCSFQARGHALSLHAQC